MSLAGWGYVCGALVAAQAAAGCLQEGECSTRSVCPAVCCAATAGDSLNLLKVDCAAATYGTVAVQCDLGQLTCSLAASY